VRLTGCEYIGVDVHDDLVAIRAARVDGRGCKPSMDNVQQRVHGVGSAWSPRPFDVGGRFRGNRAERRTSGIESGEQQGSVVGCEPGSQDQGTVIVAIPGDVVGLVVACSLEPVGPAVAADPAFDLRRRTRVRQLN